MVILDYQRRSWLTPKRTRRLLLATVFTAAAVLLCLYGRRIFNYTSILILESRCRHYQDSRPNVPVFIGLVPTEYIVVKGDTAVILDDLKEWTVICAENPDLCQGGLNPHSRTMGRQILSWQQFRDRLGILRKRPSEPVGTVFLGELRSPKGTTRLVAVEFVETFRMNSVVPMIAYEIAVLGSGRQVVWTSARSVRHPLAWSKEGPGESVAIYPGHVIADDPSAFEARVVVTIYDPGINSGKHNVERMLVGTLRDDDTVELKVK